MFWIYGSFSEQLIFSVEFLAISAQYKNVNIAIFVLAAIKN